MSIIDKADAFAAGAHAAVRQKRKYTGYDYIDHPRAVAEIVRQSGGSDEMIAAALLHDTIEDTGVTFVHIMDMFGTRVAEMVDAVTNKASKEDGGREDRLFINVLALRARLDIQSRVIKLADLVHNTSSIMQYDQTFAARYLAEKDFILRVLFTDFDTGTSLEEIESRAGDHPLLTKAQDIIKYGVEKLPADLLDTYELVNSSLMARWKSINF